MFPTDRPESELLPAALEMNANPIQRIAYPESADDEAGVYGRMTNGQRISGYLPKAIQDGITAQSVALLREGALAPDLRELIIVRTGYHTASAYEVVQHRSLSESLGVSSAVLDELACVSPKGLGAAETAMIAFVDELLTRNRPRDGALQDVLAHFTIGQVIEIIFVTGNWWTLARMLETAGVPLDERKIGDAG